MTSSLHGASTPDVVEEQARSAREPQLRRAGSLRSAASNGAGGSCARVHAVQDTPPRASPSGAQAMAPPGGAGNASVAGSHSRAPHSGSDSSEGSLAGERAPNASGAKHAGAGGRGRSPSTAACDGAGGREQLGVLVAASGAQLDRTAAIPGEGIGAHDGVRRRRGPNPFCAAGR